LSIPKNRVNYLNSLQKRKAEERQLDSLEASEIYKGFTREEIKEINIEMP